MKELRLVDDAAVSARVGAPRNDTHIDALDGIRGVAVLMILVVHCDIFLAPDFAPPGSVHAPIFVWLSDLGWTGVDLFFVLSGMLITGILLDSKGASGYFRSFYARRTLRIFPLYYFALIVLTLVLPFAERHVLGVTPQPRHGTPWVWAYLTNVVIARWEDSSVVGPLTSHFWSLGVEEQFYLIWPFLVYWLTPAALRRAAVAMIVVATVLRFVITAIGGHPSAGAILLPTRMDTLAFGALIAIAAREPGGLRQWRAAAPWVIAACVAGFAVVAGLGRSLLNFAPLVQRYGFTLIAVGYACLLVLVIEARPGDRLARFLTEPRLRWVGSRGYAVYVWHPLFVHGLMYLYWQRRSPFFMALPLAVQWAILFGIVFAGSMIAAELSWRLIESPFLSLKRFVPRPVAPGGPGPAIGAARQAAPPVAATA